MRSTLLEGASFRNQKVLQQLCQRPLFTKVYIVKSYPTEAFSIPIIMIFNVDSNYAHPRFWNPTIDIVLSSYSGEIPGVSEKIDFLKSRFMRSRGVKSHH